RAGAFAYTLDAAFQIRPIGILPERIEVFRNEESQLLGGITGHEGAFEFLGILKLGDHIPDDVRAIVHETSGELLEGFSVARLQLEILLRHGAPPSGSFIAARRWRGPPFAYARGLSREANRPDGQDG